MTDLLQLTTTLDSCLDEEQCKAFRIYRRASSGGRLLRKYCKYIVIVKLTILLVCSDKDNE